MWYWVQSLDMIQTWCKSTCTLTTVIMCSSKNATLISDSILLWILIIKLRQLCPTLPSPMDCSPPGYSIHGISQARISEWVVMLSSKGSSQPRNGTHISFISCIGRQVLYHQHHLESLKQTQVLLVNYFFLHCSSVITEHHALKEYQDKQIEE